MLRVGDRAWEFGYEGDVYAVSAMSEDQLSAFLAAVKADAGLQEKLKAAGDLDAKLEVAQLAGFVVSKADWIKHQAQQTLEISDEDLEGVAGGDVKPLPTANRPPCYVKVDPEL